MSSDIERIRREVPLAETAARFGVNLQKDGDEWIACCPFHLEKTASFTIFTGKDRVQRFHCFGCGEHGDVLDFTQKIKGVDLKEAINILGGRSSRPNIAPRQVEVRDIYAGFEPVAAPREIKAGERVKLYNPKRVGTEREWGSFVPSLIHPYRQRDGKLIGYVLRHDFKDGGKETPMIMWVRRPDGGEGWCRFSFPKPRPLYGLDALRDGQVFVVEGEKCRDRLDKASGRNALSWAGGTQGAKHADWSALAGRDVIIWPDADSPGVKTAQEIAGILAGLGAKSIRVLDVQVGGEGDKAAYSLSAFEAGEKAPHQWDVADAVDAGWSKAEIDQFMRATARAWSPPPPPTKPVMVPAASGKPVVEARTIEQAKPDEATITHIHTRATVKADDIWTINLVSGEKGVKPNVSKNWALFMENHPDMSGVFAWDAFKLRVMLMRCPPWGGDAAAWKPRTMTDRDIAEAVMWLEALHLTPKNTNILPVIQAVAERAAFDRLREYLEGLKWDGTPRVSRFANDCLGVAGDNYAPIVSERWLISSVARGLKPGCKVDTMPILEGPQGLNKSTAVKALYGAEFFSDNLSDITSKDALMELQGVWGLEVAEMHRLSNAEVNAAKKFLSRDVDRYRPPYGRMVVEAPRRCVMVGTINPEGNAYLRDPTGARRFWPLECGRIDLDKIRKDRDQLWAEAVQMFKAGTPWWVQAGELAAVEIEQEKRTDSDVWMDKIAPITKAATALSQWDIFKELGITAKDADYRHASRVGRIMKKLGWKPHRDRSDGEDRTVYRAPHHVPPPSPAPGEDKLDPGW